MSIRVYLILIYGLFTSTLYAQNRTKIYFIEKIKPDRFFIDPRLYSPDMKFQSAGVELYKYRNGIKEDSLFVMAEGFRCWGDSIAFNVDVPNRFVSNASTVSLDPIFYLKKHQRKRRDDQTI